MSECVKQKNPVTVSEITPIVHNLPNKAASSTYGLIHQGPATNKLTKLGRRKNNVTVDAITGAASILEGEITVTFPNLLSAEGLRTTSYRLLDAMTKELTETGAKEPTVTMTLTDYMDMCGLSDRKEARRQVEADLQILFDASISLREKASKKKIDQGFMDVRICEKKGISRAGVIMMQFSNTFFNLLKGYPTMPYPPQLFRLNSKRNPNSFYFLRKISEHKRMNAGKKNEDIIGVKTLLTSSPKMKDIEEVLAGNRNITDRIITPFERDMDVLSDTLKWEYCHANGTPLTEEELPVADYDSFIALLVHVTWNDYPDQTHLLEARAARAAEAQERKRTRKKTTKTKGEA